MTLVGGTERSCWYHLAGRGRGAEGLGAPVSPSPHLLPFQGGELLAPQCSKSSLEGQCGPALHSRGQDTAEPEQSRCQLPRFGSSWVSRTRGCRCSPTQNVIPRGHLQWKCCPPSVFGAGVEQLLCGWRLCSLGGGLLPSLLPHEQQLHGQCSPSAAPSQRGHRGFVEAQQCWMGVRLRGWFVSWWGW